MKMRSIHVPDLGWLLKQAGKQLIVLRQPEEFFHSNSNILGLYDYFDL